MNKYKNIKKSKLLSSLPTWDLKDFYTGIDSKLIKKDISEINQKTNDFVKKYESNVKKLNSINLFKAIKDIEKIHEKMTKV